MADRFVYKPRPGGPVGVLAHELAHIGRVVVRGIGGCRMIGRSCWSPMSGAADRGAAREMVPVDVLRDWLVHQDGGVTAGDVSVEWEVALWLAAVALDLAGERWAA